MAMNDVYHQHVLEYMLRRDVTRIAARGVAMTFATLIPMRLAHTYKPEVDAEWPDNELVVANIKRLHMNSDYPRAWPKDLGLKTIRVETEADLPQSTTYGQTYFIKDLDCLYETCANGITYKARSVLSISIGDSPHFNNSVDIEVLKAKARERGMELVVTCKAADHPDNIIGLEKMRKFLNGQEEKEIDAAGLLADRMEERVSWSRTSGKLNIKTRPQRTITRMMRNKRGG